MSVAPTWVIRNGRIMDGSGGDPFEADIAITDGRISAIGSGIANGAAEIDARDKLVTPGFVDVHTHYDAQVTWSERLSPSTWNGVTTVLPSNCGVGFAPCQPDQRNMLVKLMEGVEEIPRSYRPRGCNGIDTAFPISSMRWMHGGTTPISPHRFLTPHARLRDGAARGRPRTGDGARSPTHG